MAFVGHLRTLAFTLSEMGPTRVLVSREGCQPTDLTHAALGFRVENWLKSAPVWPEQGMQDWADPQLPGA